MDKLLPSILHSSNYPKLRLAPCFGATTKSGLKIFEQVILERHKRIIVHDDH